MINVKLIVFLSFVDIVFGNPYCEICPDHTLCIYSMPGPGTSCKLYDNTVRLTNNDIKEIVTKLNERRNYVAMGHNKFLPSAANMRKIRWSTELASFAQRWVDQCDQALSPDKNDQCRNLKSIPVGQNIATILEASSFNVKSFVDTWFIKILEYSGSVSYYNQSRDGRTKQFTQMIWADTSLVGCGRARFYVSHKNMMADRLVCNFAPLGNRHGKPVYAIGYPATQCAEHTVPDENFKALCRYFGKTISRSTFYSDRKNTSPSPRVSSLLRILNLSNSSAKQAIDPLIPLKPNDNITDEQKYQKYRHIENNTYGGMHANINQYNINPEPMTSFNYNQKMMPVTFGQERRTDRHQEKGHSRVNHEHHLHTIEEIKPQKTTWQNFRRFNYVTEAVDADYPQDFRKCNSYNQCTRKGATTCYTEIFYPKVQCTRKSHDDCPPTQAPNQFQENIVPREMCPCNIPKSSCTTPSPIPTKCMCNVNCQCLHLNSHKNRYPNNLRTQVFTVNTRKSVSNIDYYDHFSNIGLRSGDKNRNKAYTLKNNWQFKSVVSSTTETQKSLLTKKYISFDNINNFKESYDDNLEDTYKKLDFYRRHKRDSNDESYKPFWKMDELTPKISPELKSLRYTTLSNRKHKGIYRKTTMVTEPITINLSDNNQINRKFVTEKYLSFDELMHLRKLGETDIDLYEARRTQKTTKKAAATTKKAAATTKAAVTTKKATVTTKAAAATTKAATTTKKATVTTKATTQSTTKSSEITANTPFERKKHCTRKLTCTWTAVTVTGADGSVIGGWEMEKVSLTPEGYVDGCTRTSTCTRIYMNRNKFSTVGDSSDDGNLSQADETSGDGSSLHGDEDYCEKRALDIRRRESDVEKFNENTTPDIISQMSSPPSRYDSFESNTEKMNYEHSHDPSDCTCEDTLRVKRAENQYNHINSSRETVSYGDMYYRVLKKIVNGWRKFHPSDKSKCACNSGIRSIAKSYILFILNYLVI